MNKPTIFRPEDWPADLPVGEYKEQPTYEYVLSPLFLQNPVPRAPARAADQPTYEYVQSPMFRPAPRAPARVVLTTEDVIRDFTARLNAIKQLLKVDKQNPMLKAEMQFLQDRIDTLSKAGGGKRRIRQRK